MCTISIRLPEEKHERLTTLAAARHISVNKFIDKLATIALVAHDTQLRSLTRAKRGNPQVGLELLDKLAQREQSPS